MKTTEKMMEHYFEHLEKYEKLPVISNILVQKTTFKNEVQKFYNLYTKLNQIESQKTGSSPKDLVQILDVFNKDSFDISKLIYDEVREDYQRWNSSSRQVKIFILGMGGLLAGISGIGTCIGTLILGGMSEIAISAGIVGVSGGISYGLAISPFLDPQGTNHEMCEYHKLEESARKADIFMNMNYRDYFIKKTLLNRIKNN